jgi:hypothetical protein
MRQESQSACKEISMIVAHNNRIDGLDLLPHNVLHLKFADDVFIRLSFKWLLLATVIIRMREYRLEQQ